MDECCRPFGIGNGMDGKNCGVHPNPTNEEKREGQASGYGWSDYTEDTARPHKV
jgi:hypothetical protein